ncbi:MAG: hypothetical protein L7T24_09695 [Luminiphilus sp.]|nr:hypothetical protein [Luminiphilus sp.]
MLTLNKLEKIMELEAQLRDEYKEQLEGKDKEISTLTNERDSLTARVDELQSTLATQLETISSLSGKASDTKAVENRNRELHNRAENMKEEVATVKARLKALQKDLATERAELAALKKFDPERMRKNLDANKRKLAEKNKAADQLQKSYNQSKAENARLEQRVKELEAAQADADVSDEAENQAAA